MDKELDLEFKPTYDWCVRAFSLVKKRLGINICLHDDDDSFANGDIYLFNHFARFETIIPQYLIYQSTGQYCRCVAAGELFNASQSFASFLYGLGALPHNYPRLLPFLAAEILRGRKVIFFPEGGMVKDRQVMEDSGEFSVFSPTAKMRRKHHKGAAVLALMVELFKQRVQAVFEAKDHRRLERWAHALQIDSIDSLLEVANKPTEIIPANITFYPIRACDNILSRSAEFFSKGSNPRLVEEVLIEANILLKDCDMDIRISRPLHVQNVWHWWERKLLAIVFHQINALDDFFRFSEAPGTTTQKLFKICSLRGTSRLRDYYMEAIYSGVTVNLYHLASLLIRRLVELGKQRLPKPLYHKALYLAIKACQADDKVHLHASLDNPENYWQLARGQTCPELEKYLVSEGCAEHIRQQGRYYCFDDSLIRQSSFNRVRLENLIQVYANEVTPIHGAVSSVEDACNTLLSLERTQWAWHLYDDERRSAQFDWQRFQKKPYLAINQKEQARGAGKPYLYLPEGPRNKIGVLLVHGLLASPAELSSFARQISDLGYVALGVRLKGHGSSPWDLKDRRWFEWLESIQRGRRILSAFADRIFLVGFATGGTLCLLEAARHSKGICGVAAVSVPWEFKTSHLMAAYLAYGWEQLTSWTPVVKKKGIFRDYLSENPALNYHSFPTRIAYELHLLHDELARELPEISCPIRLYQGTDDPVVEARGVKELFKLIGSKNKQLQMIESVNHGILHQNIGDCQRRILDFIGELEKQQVDLS
ncbi:serine aminopeptidase domain-containing protein [Dongshaea marina]|uniref:serine aminopeptidase domain-containing protein n=1 Tax=Dongshaea marina TaxID=2047966 RepID=UPI000D3E1E41|nr:alpha/beta hydrolase [Dongshaea marina]